MKEKALRRRFRCGRSLGEGKETLHMTLEFKTTEVAAQDYVGIRATTPKAEIGQVMGPLFGEVYGHIQQSGGTPAGMPFSIYHAMEGDTIELECGMPVVSPMAGTDRINASALPGGTVATVTHMGPYDDLPQTWAALVEWIGSQGLAPAGAPWEGYVTDPGAEPDQSKWRTDIFFPVRG